MSTRDQKLLKKERPWGKMHVNYVDGSQNDGYQ